MCQECKVKDKQIKKGITINRSIGVVSIISLLFFFGSLYNKFQNMEVMMQDIPNVISESLDDYANELTLYYDERYVNAHELDYRISNLGYTK